MKRSIITGAASAVVMAAALGTAAPVGAQTDPACACSAQPPQTAEDARFKAIYTAEWEWRQHQFADDEDSADSSISATLPDVSAATQVKRLARWQDVAKQLEDIDRAKLSPDDQVNYDVYKAQIDVLINQQKFKDYERPLNADN